MLPKSEHLDDSLVTFPGETVRSDRCTACKIHFAECRVGVPSWMVCGLLPYLHDWCKWYREVPILPDAALEHMRARNDEIAARALREE